VHLPTSVREQIRSVPSLHIPSEQSMIKCKQQLAHTHATATGTFAGGAYITDPIRFVSVVCAQSSVLVVGGDAGGGHTKLGVTYTHDGVQHFNPERIVPSPLHLFLGISNRIILDVFAELFSEQQVASILKPALTLHSPGCGGLGDVHDLTGPEICKWLKQDCNAQLLAAACEKENISAAVQATFSVLSRWLHQLHNHLLHKSDWTLQLIEEWRAAVDDIQKHWCSETGHDPFPKLHMLRHSLEFAERHRFLGRASEAQIESFHAQFNALFHKQHRNQAGNTAERLRRSLADAALRAVQPMLSSSSTPS